jgi:hypothetical protein
LDGVGRPSINGKREQANNFLLDGIDNNQVSDNLVGYMPSVAAIREFNVITQNASAEYGNFQGGIISVSIKSGTGNFHGGLYEYFRNDALNANTWASGFTHTPKPRMHWNMFGGSLGGPIVEKRLFIFTDYQGQRFDHPSAISPITVFTSAEAKGDFSGFCPSGFTAGLCSSNDGIQLYNPFNVIGGERQPFLNNQIPISMINPVAAHLFASKAYPQPVNRNLVNNAFSVDSSALNADQGDLKLDYIASHNDRIFARYSAGTQDNPSANSVTVLATDNGAARLRNGVVNWTHDFSSGFHNEVRFGVNYVRLSTKNSSTADNGIGNFGEQLGIANSNSRGPGLIPAIRRRECG